MTNDKPKLLIVEDDLGLRSQLKWCFDDYEVLTADDRTSAMAELRRHAPAVVLQDLGLPPDPTGVSEGMQTLSEILQVAPETKVIVVTGNSDRDNAVRSVSRGAYDFCVKPVDTDVLKLIVSRAFHIHALETRNRELMNAAAPAPLAGIIAPDEPMRRVCRLVERVAPTDATVLILGESGTGKELLARALHEASPRRVHRFVPINCAAIPEALLETELFGHEKGAFTGAVRQVVGKVEIAAGGTLFLDEIGDMPLPLQAKLLRFLQGRVIERVGGRTEIPVDVRVVCATNQNLQELTTEQRFRQDLYFRISEITINVPPLRDRPGARPVLAQALLRRLGALHGPARRGFSEDALAAIEAYSWPGNVRELENKVKTGLIMADGPLITARRHGARRPGRPRICAQPARGACASRASGGPGGTGAHGRQRFAGCGVAGRQPAHALRPARTTAGARVEMNGSARTFSDETATVERAPSRVNAPLAIALGSLVLVAALYWPTSLEIADLWQDTVRRRYTHGWLVLAVTVWLIWRDRAQLRSIALTPPTGGWCVVALGSVGWLVGLNAGLLAMTTLAMPLLVLAAHLGGGWAGRCAAGRFRGALSLLRASGLGTDQPAAPVNDGLRERLADPTGGHSGDDGGEFHPHPRGIVRDRGRLQRSAFFCRRIGHRCAPGRDRSV